MQPLLLSTDFDGTIYDHDHDVPLAGAFLDWLRRARQKRKIIWVINTGRDWTSLREELESNQIDLWPDWVVLVEREIHRVEDEQTKSLQAWNHSCQQIHADLFTRARDDFEETREKLARFENLQTVVDTGSPLGIIAADEPQADEVETILAPLLDKFPEMHTVRNSIYFRFAHVDYHKGSCLGMITAEEGMSAEQCFAVGDHHNDIAMLDTTYAHAVACPSNSDQRVLNHVQEMGGYVAKLPADRGVAEALDHFFGNPDHWDDSAG
ncbi:MAG: HAD family hydrolase [Verrucomicrobiota bacterium]